MASGLIIVLELHAFAHAVQGGRLADSGVQRVEESPSKCIKACTMNVPTRVHPEPTEGTGTDSPRALLPEQSHTVTDRDDDDYIPSSIDRKVRCTF